MIEKMRRDYPLFLQTHLLQWRLYSAEPDADQVKNSSLATPYPGVQELGVLLQAAHGAEVDEATALLARRVDFEGWPEIYFLAAHGPGEETAGWAQKFLISCGYGAGAAAPKYPAAICQKVPEMKELADPQQGSQR